MKYTFLAVLAMAVLVGCTQSNTSLNKDIPVSNNNQVSDDIISDKNIEDVDIKLGSQDASTWTTYKNIEHGFEIKHPTDLNVEEYADVPYGPNFVFSRNCEDDSDCRKFGVVILLEGRFQEPFYESDLTEGLTVAGRAASIVTDPKLRTKGLFESIMNGDGSECKKPQLNEGISSALRFSNPPPLWSESDNLVTFFCSDKSHAPILKEMLSSFRFL